MFRVPRTTRQYTRHRAAIRRRRLVAASGLVTVAVLALFVVRGFGSTDDAGTLVLTSGGRTSATVALVDHVRGGELVTDGVRRAIEQALPRSSTTSRGRTRITYRYDVAETVVRALRLGREGGRVEVVRRAVSASTRAAILKQAQANTCESAALSILMGAMGRQVDQTELQNALPRSGPLDPDDSGPTRVWGDPERGYVGRPEGGGIAGGFGVFQAPVRATAGRYGVELQDMTGRPASELYARLLTGRPVMAWVGLSEGPYGSWVSPEGREVKVNFGEHTVVLYGIRADGSLRVSNPLEGTDEVWSRAKFEQMWQRLDRRALAA